MNELKEAFNLLLHWNEYENLRSVIKPNPLIILTFYLNRERHLRESKKIWEGKEKQVINAFKTSKLKYPQNAVCYIHSISCEGWFDIENGNIHARFYKTGGDNEYVETIIHELLHLATYKPEMSYEEREDIVDEYLTKKLFQEILKG